MTPGNLDELDARIVRLYTDEPNVGVLGASRRLGVARGTVQARLDRLTERGVIRSFAPTVDPGALGYPVTAFCTLEIRQGRGHGPVVEHLSRIPEVLEAHTITGSGDLLHPGRRSRQRRPPAGHRPRRGRLPRDPGVDRHLAGDADRVSDRPAGHGGYF